MWSFKDQFKNLSLSPGLTSYSAPSRSLTSITDISSLLSFLAWKLGIRKILFGLLRALNKLISVWHPHQCLTHSKYYMIHFHRKETTFLGMSTSIQKKIFLTLSAWNRYLPRARTWRCPSSTCALGQKGHLVWTGLFTIERPTKYASPRHMCATSEWSSKENFLRYPLGCFRASALWIVFFHHLKRVISLKFSQVTTEKGDRVHSVLYCFSYVPQWFLNQLNHSREEKNP